MEFPGETTIPGDGDPRGRIVIRYMSHSEIRLGLLHELNRRQSTQQAI
jgi:hypothetical protein